nr:transposon TX1 [Tanacetum cinerariifolium]
MHKRKSVTAWAGHHGASNDSANHGVVGVRFKESNTQRPLLDSPRFRNISEPDADFFESEFTIEEVRGAVWDCAGSKAPGPDGFNFNFIKTFWDVVKIDFSRRSIKTSCLPSCKSYWQMGFGHNWRNWIASCLSSASISVLINGSPSNEFFMERGLRQGDPLSLFFSFLLPKPFRSLFSTLVIGTNAYNLINILRCFELGSGLKINLEKSCLFGVGIPVSEVISIASSLGCDHEEQALWRTVIKEFYGDDGGFDSHSDSQGGSDGENTSFWHDAWCGDGTRFKDKFHRLFFLDSSNDCKVKDRVKSLTKVIESSILSKHSLGSHHKCNSWIPRKVNVMVWKASLNRLATRLNLAARGVALASTNCSFCDSDTEDIEHVLIKSPRARDDIDSIKNQDIFSGIQRMAKIWMSARIKSKLKMDWNSWVKKQDKKIKGLDLLWIKDKKMKGEDANLEALTEQAQHPSSFVYK